MQRERWIYAFLFFVTLPLFGRDWQQCPAVATLRPDFYSALHPLQIGLRASKNSHDFATATSDKTMMGDVDE